jgi:hypothetical protein
MSAETDLSPKRVSSTEPLPHIAPSSLESTPGYVIPKCPVDNADMVWVLCVDPDTAGLRRTLGTVETQPTAMLRMAGVSAMLVCTSVPNHTIPDNVLARCAFSARLEQYIPGGPSPWATPLAK